MTEKEYLLTHAKDVGGYLLVANNVMRRIFPAIIAQDEIELPPTRDKDGNEKRRTLKGPEARDAIPIYFYLMAYTNGKETLEDGSPNPRCGWAFPNVDRIEKTLKIARRRIKPLCDLLVMYGLMETREEWRGSKRKKLYRPIPLPVEMPAKDDDEEGWEDGDE